MGEGGGGFSNCQMYSVEFSNETNAKYEKMKVSAPLPFIGPGGYSKKLLKLGGSILK